MKYSIIILWYLLKEHRIPEHNIKKEAPLIDRSRGFFYAYNFDFFSALAGFQAEIRQFDLNKIFMNRKPKTVLVYLHKIY